MRLISDEALAICTIWMEARGEGYEGMLAVARVLRNRMRLRYQSDGTVSGTCLKPFQFSSWNSADPNRLLAVRLDSEEPFVKECQRAWEESEAPAPGFDEVVLYYNPKAVRETPLWAVATKLAATIGSHQFYRA